MGSLILVTTPIGNLGDITERAKNALVNTKAIASEDTRVTKELLKRLDIKYEDKLIESFHDHSSDSKLSFFLKILNEQDLVIVSDAGSPAISDPCLPLVQLAIENDICIQTCPGVSSVITALELSGLPSTPFFFHGFLPRKEGKKAESMESFNQIKGTHVFFESVHRVKETLVTLSEVFPDSQMAVCRELTKEYESIYRGMTSDISKINSELIEKGEFVICIYNEKVGGSSSKLTALANEVLASRGKTKQLSKLLAEILNEDTKSLYGRLTEK